MIKIIYGIYLFLRKLWTILETLWFAIHGVIRFVFRMITVIPDVIQSLPVWLLPVCLMALAVGLGLFALGRG